ncbi:hypothetical protein [Parafrankia sp. EUN1f]|uniref:hypothetical protein n=1 Tax=Parafrankia sp. EUN1f TaxID=102897 RepID=UPI0009FE9F38|nr:hypothetical protein [Parafrankia sp. EUN1f]
MVADPDRYLDECRSRYSPALSWMRDVAGRRGVAPWPDWPEWCWLPMAAVAGAGPRRPQDSPRPQDIGRLAALSTWWLDRAVVEVDEDLAVRHLVSPGADIRIDRERLLTGLPAWCPYVLLPPRPETVAEVYWPRGFFVHTEWDAATGGAELRLLMDTDGTWDGLQAIPVHLDQPTVRWSFQDAARVMTANAAAGLVAGAQADDPRLAAGVEMGGLVAAQVWPLVSGLVDPAGRVIGRDRPGEVLERARAERRGTRMVWPLRSRTSFWRVTAGPAPRPVLRPV